MMYTVIIACPNGEHQNMYSDLYALGYTPIACNGEWGGQPESGYLVNTALQSIDFVLEIARDYEQSHAIIIERETRKTWIVNTTFQAKSIVGFAEHDGLWCRVPENKITGDYTYIPSVNAFCQIK